MSLINCPECKREISDQTISCPHCGYPMRLVTIVGDPDKKWKMVQLFSGIIMLFGLIAVAAECSAVASGEHGSPGIGIILLCLGLLSFLIGRVGAWWNHR